MASGGRRVGRRSAMYTDSHKLHAGMNTTDTDDTDTTPQTVRAQLRLRELVVGGEIAAGERITELALVDRLGMSRTPIRAALVRLQDEGLLQALPGGGFVVRAFSEADIHDAIELRGTLEGLAVRLAAERGVAEPLLRDARATAQQIDELLAPSQLSAAAFSRYVALNGKLHRQLAAMAGSTLVERQIDRAALLPFASPNSFVIVNTTGPRARDRLVVAHEQHHAVLNAIAGREGARAEALMREHARNAQSNLADALQNQRSLKRVPGAGLIQGLLRR